MVGLKKGNVNSANFMFFKADLLKTIIFAAIKRILAGKKKYPDILVKKISGGFSA
jgi:hypothetical protein